MRIEGSSISCGVQRLIIAKDEKLSKEKLLQVVNGHKDRCAMLVTGVPTARRDIVRMLVETGFKRIKDTEVKQGVWNTVKAALDDLAFLVMFHDHEYDALNPFEEFVETTVKENLSDLTTLVLHHGEYIGDIAFFVRAMK